MEHILFYSHWSTPATTTLLLKTYREGLHVQYTIGALLDTLEWGMQWGGGLRWDNL